MFDVIKYPNEKNFEINLDGDLICTHKQTDFCNSLSMGPCSICVDCGEHSYGANPWKPKIIKTKQELELIK